MAIAQLLTFHGSYPAPLKWVLSIYTIKKSGDLAISRYLEEVEAEFADKVTFVKCNVDEADALAEQYSIRSIPTLVFFKDGQGMDRSVGAMSKKDLVSKIKSLLD